MTRDEEQRSHALEAALSRRDWRAVEVAHAAIRDAAHKTTQPSPVFPSYPHQPGMKYCHSFGFVGGSLSIYARGYGVKDGSGYFAFQEDDLDWSDDGSEAVRVVKADRSELVELRDKLIEAFPLEATEPRP